MWMHVSAEGMWYKTPQHGNKLTCGRKTNIIQRLDWLNSLLFEAAYLGHKVWPICATVYMGCSHWFDKQLLYKIKAKLVKT